jgi:hypothetical protein
MATRQRTDYQRVDRAAAAVQAYTDIPGTDPDEFLTDLLADLIHYAKFNGLDFGQAIRMAQHHAEAEMSRSLDWRVEP